MRAVMISSLDGAGTGPDGLSGALAEATRRDRELFTILRSLADAVVVGAATAVAEGYGSSGHNGPELVVIAPSADTPDSAGPDAPTEAATADTTDPAAYAPGLLAPGTVLVAGPAAPPALVEAARAAGADLVRTSIRPTPAEILSHLAARGRQHVVLEGGPRLLGAFLTADLVDELSLSLAPVVTGGGASRIVDGAGLGLRGFRLRLLWRDEDDAVFTLWRRRR